MLHSTRTFVAVDVSPDIGAGAARLINRLDAVGARVRWVKPEQMHLTLKFLGEVRLREVPEVCDAVTRAVAAFPPFLMRVAAAGAFPESGSPRTVWLGVDEGADDVAALFDAVDAELGQIGYRREQRRFRPHLTIGRVRGTGPGLRELVEAIAEQADFVAGIVDVGEVIVYSSELTRDGPVYEPLATAPLEGD